MRVKSCRLDVSAQSRESFPRAGYPQVAFMGASNVGKSSLINRLLGNRRLARTSKAPGRTRAIHFYLVNENLHFVDLPGYGYARVPAWMRREWKTLVESYLQSSRGPDLAVLLADARREPSGMDLELIDWLRSRRTPHQVVLTKTDKLSRARLDRAVPLAGRRLGLSEGEPPLCISSVTGDGIPALWHVIDAACAGRRRSPVVVPLPEGDGISDTDRAAMNPTPRGAERR